MQQPENNARKNNLKMMALPVAVAALAVLWMAGLAYYILTRTIVTLHGTDSLIATALGNKAKEIVSLAAYALAIALSFAHTGFSLALYVMVALMWLIPDRRIEGRLETRD